MQSGVRISEHRSMVSSDTFERSADSAMLQYQSLVAGQIANGNDAIAAGFKLQGALEFLQTFRLLAETPRMPMPVITDNLNAKV